MKNKIICLAFLILVFGFTLFDVITPVRDFSEWENKNLAQKPDLSTDKLLSGEYGSEYETYITEQFVMRDSLVKLKAVSDKLLGKKELGGVYVTKESLYSVQPEPDYEIIEKNLSAIDSFSKKLDAPTHLLVVPSSTYVYRDLLPKFAPTVNEDEIFDYICNNLKYSNFIDVMDKMVENRKDYIYFRTDHHWTSDGALIGYNSFLRAIDKGSLTRDDFTVSKVSDSFVGTLSSKSGELGVEEDVIERFDKGEVISCEVWNGVESEIYSSVFFDEYLDRKDKYSYYLGTNQPIVKIQTGSQGGKLLVFKDSYAHIMTPMMIDDFSEIVLVDLRYVKEKIEVLLERIAKCSLNDFSQVLFLYSADTFTTQYNMLWIR